ncbi:MAG: ATP-dependent RNA helicase HrpA [Alcanivoracaceae bacterium]|nr:ATP-dependent RNA helicase HrpA [Alcanivoracaceae bacterium]
MSTDSLDDLQARLEACRSRDRHALHLQIQRQRRQPDAVKLAELAARVDASAASSRARAASVPALQWPALPVCDRRDELARAIRDHQVVVVAGETGSGKTTQLPKICLSLGRGVRGLIGHTQPRRLAARAVASRVAEELGTQVGDKVGMQVRFADNTSEASLLKVMTDGILLAEIQRDRFLNAYDTLIIDEAHERSLNIDFLLGYLKQLLPRRPDLKLIITSATIDVDRFSEHFDNAPVIEVSGRSFPVTVHYRPPADDTDLPSQIETVLAEIESHERRVGRPAACDVLVFLSGERDIRDAHHHLRRCQFRDTEFLPLYARLSQKEQQRIFAGHRGRRVVLSTNVAETSLTVPGIRYVIDAGTARISRYSVQSKVQRLPVEKISQASASQRAGRCGRIMPGDCYRLYDEQDFLARPAFTDAEIQRTNLAAVILRMADLRLGDVSAFPFVDAPDPRLVRDGYRLLEELGAIAGRKLTALGRKLARLPVDPRLGRMLLEASDRQALSEALVIVSALAVQDPRERPESARQQADQAHAAFTDKQSDFLFYTNLWRWADEQRQALSRNQYEKTLRKHFLSPVRMREWRETHHQLLTLCREMKLTLSREPATFEQLHRSLLAGLLVNCLKRTEEGDWLSTRNRKPLLWPGSALSRCKGPWLMAAEQVETSRLFARTLAEIDVAWLEQAADHLVKRQYLEPHWSKKKGCVMAREQVSLFGLILRSGKRVHYGPIDPVLSRELLIREGLVAGSLREEPAFVRHNEETIEALSRKEDKLRRRDLIADEEARVMFYQERLPEGLYTLTHVLDWYRNKASDSERKALLMDADFLLGDSAGVSESGFPDVLTVEGTQFPLLYEFNPQGENDGVTVVVPVTALNQLSSERLEWLVPGLLAERIEALIRGLPKNRRRNFVPVPDYVQALCGALSPGDGSLLAAMTRELQRMTGVRVELEEWQQVAVPAYLHMRVRVMDGDRVLAQSDDLAALQKAFAERVVTPVTATEEPAQVSTSWCFGQVAEQQTRNQGGISVRLYPALDDAGDGARLGNFASQAEADWHMWQGVSRLLLCATTQQTRTLRQHNRRQPAWQALSADRALGGDSIPEQALVRAAADHFGASAVVRDEAAFAALLNGGRGDWLEAGQRWFDRTGRMLARYRAIRKQLDRDFPLAWAHAHGDIKTQLGGLVFPGFLLAVPAPWLDHYDRFMEAIQRRLEKLSGQVNKDRAMAAEVQEFEAMYRARAGDSPLWALPEPLLQFRFMIEEFRVSLFAQQLGTSVPVSAKRLRAQWERC